MRIVWLVVSILNIVDAFSTYFGLKWSVIEEGNPFMANLWSTSPFLFLSIKLLLSGLVFYLFVHRQVRPPGVLYRLSPILTLLIYGYITILHSYWLMSYIA
jgi:hypothetical protein